MAALLLSVSTGWRIAAMHDDNLLLRWADALLLRGNVLRWHFVSATALVALVLGYLAFLWRTGLAGRLARRPSRWRASASRASTTTATAGLRCGRRSTARASRSSPRRWSSDARRCG